LKDYNAVLVKLNVGSFKQKLYFPMAVQLILENTLIAAFCRLAKSLGHSEQMGWLGRWGSNPRPKCLFQVSLTVSNNRIKEIQVLHLVSLAERGPFFFSRS
jgi:hypothetical protein